VAAVATTVPKILIVGDSISNGVLGDYTWRYRLWQNLIASKAHVQFVGHRTGTENIYDDPAALASLSGQPLPADNYGDPTDGYYRRGINPAFTRTAASSHDALWGWSYHQAKDHITQDVTAYHPTYLLIELGVNDVTYNSPAGALADAKTLIHNARAVDPKIRVLVANVVHRTPICGFSYLNPAISTYNRDLATAVRRWSTSRSPVRLVNISSGYNPSTDTYDGLHPNGLGEFAIADAFSTALARDFGLGKVPGDPPSRVPGITLTTPASVSGKIVGIGLLLHWSRVYGASGYKIFERDITGNPSPLPAFTELPFPLPGDHFYAGWGTPGHIYQYEVAAARGYSESSPSRAATITMPASEPLADPPVNITVTPSQGTRSVTLTWSAPSGSAYDNSISGYHVFWLDTNPPCPGFALQGAQTTQTSYTISGLTPGHAYDLALASVNAAGLGQWAGAPQVIAGDGTPAPPTVSAASANQLRWPAVPGAAGYWIYQANPVTPPNPPTWTRLPYEVPQGWNGTLAPGVYEITAANGTLESPPSNQVVLPPATSAASARATGRAGSLHMLGWTPPWFRAAPNTALVPHNSDVPLVGHLVRRRR
jgi:lysophospholipase L1-like esterase